MSVPTLVITGPVGVGKTSVAAAISDLLSQARLCHAMIDLDALRWCSPSPPHDPFQVELGLRNLAAVAANYRTAGAERLILVDIVESRAGVAAYSTAIPGAALTVVRLQAQLPTIWQRLQGRETGAALEWHRGRAEELAAQMERDRLENLLVDTEGKAVHDIAGEIALRTGWLDAIPSP